MSDRERIIKDLEQLSWDIHKNNYYDLEDEISIMNSIDEAIRIIKKDEYDE